MSSTAFDLNIAPHCTPIIDKITITVPFPNTVLPNSILNGGKTDFDSDFTKAIEDAIKDKSVFSHGRYCRYRVSRLINLKNSVERVNAQFFPKDENNTAFVRFELNPWKMAKHGLKEFADIADNFFYDGYEYVQEHGKVTRVDPAIDIHGVTVEQIQFTQGQKATSQKYSFDGEAQTLYSGSSKGQQLKAYNKAAQLKLKGGETVSRIEYKLLPQILLRELHTYPNPFKCVHIALPPAKPPLGVEKYMWRLICDSIKLRGTTAALNGLPPELRQKVKQALKSGSQKGWDTDVLWKKWHAAVQPIQTGGSIVPIGTCYVPHLTPPDVFPGTPHNGKTAAYGI